MYVCIVCVYVCIHVMRVVRLPHKLTNILLLSLLLGGPNPFGGGATNPDTGIIYIYIYVRIHLENRFLPVASFDIAGLPPMVWVSPWKADATPWWCVFRIHDGTYPVKVLMVCSWYVLYSGTNHMGGPPLSRTGAYMAIFGTQPVNKTCSNTRMTPKKAPRYTYIQSIRSCKSSESLECPKAVSESSVWYRERKSRFTFDKGMVLVPGPRPQIFTQPSVS